MFLGRGGCIDGRTKEDPQVREKTPDKNKMFTAFYPWIRHTLRLWLLIKMNSFSIRS